MALEAGESACIRTALDKMISVVGFDAVVVCTGTQHQATYWQQRLEQAKGVTIPASCVVLCVHEDWVGGAGNGLGTLYAWQKACSLYKEKGLLMEGGLEGGLERGDISVALYHTAGKGTRLAPLPGAENNNKPGVKLPCVESKELGPLTILGSVVKQTGIYAASRKGRLSVFWGDQIFVPTVPFDYEASRAHADILCLLAPMPDAAEWAANGLDKYGLVVVSKSGSACQIEKVDHATAVSMTAGLEGGAQAVGTSLGSFSLSASLLEALTEDYKAELKAKKGTFDSDPHWWMPMTLPLDAYIILMAKKDVSEETATAHHARVRRMLASFDAEGKHLLGPVDVGARAYWWDYGQLKLYKKNASRLAEDGVEADAMREFMNVSRGFPSQTGLTVDSRSCVSACSLKRGSVDRAVLTNVACPDLDATDCVLINVTAKKLKMAKNSIAYNVVDDSEEGLDLKEGDVLTDIFQPDGSVLRQRSHMETDGGQVWKTALPMNKYSFEDVYKQNLETDILATSELAKKAHADLKAKLGL